jgi:hypothetical protein
VGPVGPRRPARRVSASPGVGSSLWAVDPPFGPGDRHSLRQVKLWDIWSLDDTHTHIYIRTYIHTYIYNKVQWWICSKVHFYGYVSKFGYLEVWIRTIENHRGISIENLKKT